MRLCLAALTVLATTTQTNAAPKVAFPYEATVEAAESYVRSGPGSKYYPTARLKQGQRVVVHRHDPGWHMIAPPEGSFSWVKASLIDKLVDNRGMVNQNNVEVHIGSFESDIRDFVQRKLATGDEVQILGEKMLLPVKGSGPQELWYRIAPPRGEWRWIAGQDISPPLRDSGPSANQLGSDDPFDIRPTKSSRARAAPASPTLELDDGFERPQAATPGRTYLDAEQLSPRDARATNDSGIADRPLVRRQTRGTGNKLPSAGGSDKRLEAQLDELDRLDSRLRSILEKDPLEWDFTQLEEDYRQLHDQAASDNVRDMVNSRLARIAGHLKTRAEHQRLGQVAEETLRRDAELAEIQRRHEAQLAALRQPRYDGAGIVERSVLTRKGAPRHALLAPSGKVLAYLVPASGVNLDAWIGRAAGVTGNRVPHPDLKADLITVTRLTPVRLGQ